MAITKENEVLQYEKFITTIMQCFIDQEKLCTCKVLRIYSAETTILRYKLKCAIEMLTYRISLNMQEQHEHSVVTHTTSQASGLNYTELRYLVITVR